MRCPSRRDAAPANEGVDAANGVGAHRPDHVGRRDGVAEAHAGERGDLREGRATITRRPADVRHRRRVCRILDEVVIRLIDEHRHILGNPIEQLGDLALVTTRPVGLFGLQM